MSDQLLAAFIDDQREFHKEQRDFQREQLKVNAEQQKIWADVAYELKRSNDRHEAHEKMNEETKKEVSNLKDEYEKSWEWSKSVYEAWQKYMDKYIKPILITSIILAMAASAGIAIYDFGAPKIKATQQEQVKK